MEIGKFHHQQNAIVNAHRFKDDREPVTQSLRVPSDRAFLPALNFAHLAFCANTIRARAAGGSKRRARVGLAAVFARTLAQRRVCASAMRRAAGESVRRGRDDGAGVGVATPSKAAIAWSSLCS